jgi:hypothetical protein
MVMRHVNDITGPRFPFLRALTFLLRAAAVVALAAGGWNGVNLVREASEVESLLRPEHRETLVAACAWLGGGLLAALLLLASAELITLFLQIERNTRSTAAAFAPAPLPDDELDDPAPAVAPPPKSAPSRSSRLPWLEGDDPAEGTLLPGR